MAFLTEEDRKYRTPEDICAHVGDDYARFDGAIIPPIFQNSLFVKPTEVNGVTQTDYAYTRVCNPTTEVAERKIAALEGGDGALCFSSGMGAISSAIMHCVRANCHVILLDTAYGCTLEFIKEYLHERFNIEYTLVNGGSVEEIRVAIRPNTRLIYLESPSSLVFRMQDLDAVAALAKEHGIMTVIDNTYATPLHQQPLKHGIDIVCHTASKYMGGHSDLVAGALIARREIIESIQKYERALLGSNMDPHQSWLLTRGLRTLPVRLKRHGESAMKVARFLENNPKVEKVFYPGSDTYEQKELFDKYLTGTNGLMSFVPDADNEAIHAMVKSLDVFEEGPSWGGFESVVNTPGLNPNREMLQFEGIPQGLVRISVGLEDADTLIEDLDRALNTLPR